jgi:hypothetical protein
MISTTKLINMFLHDCILRKIVANNCYVHACILHFGRNVIDKKHQREFLISQAFDNHNFFNSINKFSSEVIAAVSIQALI